MSCVLKVEALENGFEVEVMDKKIAEKNEKLKGAWQDPWKKYAFTTRSEVLKFITQRLESLPKSADEEFTEAYREATMKDKS